MLEDIKVYSDHYNNSDLISRLECVKGLVNSSSYLKYSNDYKPHSFIPKDDWVNVDDNNIIANDILDTDEVYNKISLLNFKGSLVENLYNYIHTSTLSDKNPINHHKIFDDFKINFFQYFKEYLISENHIEVNKLIYQKRDKVMPTLAANTVTNQLTGLHVDYWDGLNSMESYMGKNRLIINLGKGARYLIFVPTTMQTLYSKYNGKKHQSSIINSSDLAKLYLLDNTSLKIYRLKVNPMEGYIFPTENMIHDGYCEINEDILWTFRGFIRLGIKKYAY